MNRSHLIPACLLGLGALAILSAQEVKLNIPGQPGAAAPAVNAPPAAAPAPTFTEPQILETFGWFVGKRVGLSELEFTKEQTDAIVKGLVAAAAGKDAPYALDKIGPQMEAFMQKKQEAFMTKLRLQNLGEAKVFFEKLKEKKTVVELPDGLRYEVLQPGTGAYPKASDTVKVHYTGTLITGTVFDSSVQRGQPVEVALTQVIPGWAEGLQKINQGGKIRLYIPPDLAYGDNGQQGIPPGAALIFDIELLEIKAPAAAAEPKK
ncbi:MAG: FKBP-type peptidyl-prolyl cis-trans isomerase [Opitutaceae bacterium]|nr:FKBP-type peptidyl-prolyl cis-trans isomerase [Opitutaceae bacterium]